MSIQKSHRHLICWVVFLNPTDNTEVVFIFAGEELQILVNAQGQWRFLDAITL